MSNATFTFGRFNPPTEEGHGKLVSAVQKHAEETGGKHYVFPTKSQDKKKNPMSHEDKVGAMRKLFPSANIVSHKGVHTAIDAMKHLESKGHTNVTMVVGSDRVDEFHGLLSKYRKKEFPGIKKVNVVSAGNRDPDAEGAEGMSASKLRGLVSSGKKKEFVSHYSDPKLGAEIHDKVKKGMQMESATPIGIFLLGGPGSGKDYVLNNIFSRFDLTEVQADQILAGSYINENKNIVINGVVDADKIEIIKNLLEGYDFDYVHVSVSNKISRIRNSMRANPLPENKRIEKWLKAEKLAESYDCFNFNNSINLNESAEMEQIIFAGQIEKLLERITARGLSLVEKEFPAVKRDKESGLPKKYVAGLSKSTAKARAAHWKEKAKLSDSDPRAYEPAPGDATAETKPSKYTKKYHAMYGEEVKVGDTVKYRYTLAGNKNKVRSGKVVHVGKNFLNVQQELPFKNKMHHTINPSDVVNEEMELDEGAADTSLAAKAKKSGVSLSTLKKVYRRGVAAWNSGHRPGTTPSQWGHARVNSYITKGKTYHTADKDLREEVEDIDKKFEAAIEENLNCCEESAGIKSFSEFKEAVETQQTADVTPDLKTSKRKGKTVPATDYRSSLAGLPVTTAKMNEETVSLEEAVKFHIENKVSFTENVFRPGSDMFFSMINEAKRLYKEGKYTPADEYEKDLLESDIGEIAEYEGRAVVLDYPVEEGLEESCWSGYTQKGMKKKGDKMVPNCVPVSEESDPTNGRGIGKPFRKGGGGAVYVKSGDSVRLVNFSQSGMKKKFMDPGATRSFVARHHCLTNKDKTSASYWACRWPRYFSNSGKTWW